MAMEYDAKTPNIRNGNGGRRGGTRSCSSPFRTPQAAVEEDSPDGGLSNAVSFSDDEANSSTSIGRIGDDKIVAFGKSAIQLMGLFETMRDKLLDSSSMKAALNVGREKWLISEQNSPVIRSMLDAEKLKLATVIENGKPLSDNEQEVHNLLAWIVPEDQAKKKKPKSENDADDLTLMLVEITKLVSIESQHSGADISILEFAQYLLEAIMLYPLGKDKYKALLGVDKMKRFMSKKQRARVEEVNQRKLGAFVYKTHAKQILLELLLGDDRMSSFVENFDKNKNGLTDIRSKTPSGLKDLIGDNAAPTFVPTGPPMSIKELKEFWIGIGPDGVPGGYVSSLGSSDAADSNGMINTTPSGSSSKPPVRIESPEVRRLLDSALAHAELRSIAERIDARNPGRGFMNSHMQGVKEAYPELFPTAESTNAGAYGRTDVKTTEPDPESGTTETGPTILGPGPYFTLELCMHNRILRKAFEASEYEDAHMGKVKDKVEEFNQKQKKSSLSTQEMAGAGLLWKLGKKQFHFTKLIAAGNQGAVYVVANNHSSVAAKVQILNVRDVPEYGIRPLLCNGLVDHENVVQLLGYTCEQLNGTNKNKIAFVTFMQELENHTLKDELESWASKEPSDKKARWIAKTMLQIMSVGKAFEKHSLLHRDLKPENMLFVKETEQVLVTDFGLSRSAASDDDEDGLTQQAGTRAYMAPESMNARTTSNKLDVYSVAVIFWEMMSGVRSKLHNAASSKTLFEAKLGLHFQQKHLKEHWPNVAGGKEMIDLCKEMLAYDYPERPTMSDSFDKMEKIAASVPCVEKTSA